MTPTEQKIEAAADTYGETTGERIWDVKEYYTDNDRSAAFTAGANYALTELLEGELEEMLTFMKEEGYILTDDADLWKVPENRLLTNAQLVQEYLNQKP